MLAFIRNLLFDTSGHNAEERLGKSLPHIEATLTGMDKEEARKLACFAYILGRVAMADQEVTPVEEKAIEVILRDVGQMKPADAQLLSALAREKRTLFGGLDDFQVTKIYTELTTEEEKLRLLDCLFAVAAADEMVHVVEEEDIRQISIGLGLRHAQYIAARQRVTAYRAVMQDTSS